jgi:hypothetical protein
MNGGNRKSETCRQRRRKSSSRCSHITETTPSVTTCGCSTTSPSSTSTGSSSVAKLDALRDLATRDRLDAGRHRRRRLWRRSAADSGGALCSRHPLRRKEPAPPRSSLAKTTAPPSVSTGARCARKENREARVVYFRSRLAASMAFTASEAFSLILATSAGRRFRASIRSLREQSRRRLVSRTRVSVSR